MDLAQTTIKKKKISNPSWKTKIFVFNVQHFVMIDG